jgi:predicted acyl esterase
MKGAESEIPATPPGLASRVIDSITRRVMGLSHRKAVSDATRSSCRRRAYRRALDAPGYGRSAAGLISRETMDWLDHHLAGERRGQRDAPVHLFVTGATEWRSYAEWPPAAQQDIYSIDDDGALGSVAGGGTSRFVFDPADR